jgi:hypothetical protein
MSTEDRTVRIVVRDQTFEAVICPQCSMRIWPALALQQHIERHEFRARLLQDYFVIPLRARLAAMQTGNAKENYW